MTAETTARVVKVYAPDLMDRSKIAAACPGAEFVRSAADLDGATLAVVDLSRPGVLDALKGITCETSIGFGAHVDRDLLHEASVRGVQQVLTRREFFGRLDAIFAA